jgi:peroxiredoxin
MKRVVFFLVSVFFSFSVCAQSVLEPQNPLIGEKAPEFNLSDLNGQKVGMSEYRSGKSMIIFFGATWCPNCHEQLIRLSKEAGALKNKGIKAILVDVQEDAKTVSARIQSYHIPFEILLDEKSDVAETYNIIGVPTIFLVGKDGIIKAVEHSVPDNYEEILNQ